jgi:hypothetical protein
MSVQVEKRRDSDADTCFYNVRLECGLALYRETAVAHITDVLV